MIVASSLMILVGLGLTSGTPESVKSVGGTHRIAFHLVSAVSEDPCVESPFDSLTCERINPEGTDGAKYMYVVVMDVEAILAFEFGIAFDGGPFGGSDWFPCTDAVEWASPGWPANRTSINMGWEPPGYADVVGPDRLVVIGAIRVEAGFSGTVRFIPAEGDASIYIIDDGEIDGVWLARRGIADLGGDGSGYVPCSLSPLKDANWSEIKSRWQVEHARGRRP
jgi:hypothetical protein